MTDQWFREFKKHFHFPNDYTTIDLETTGLVQDNDLICTVGVVQVRDGKVATQKYWVLDWPGDPAIDNAWLRRQLRRVQAAMRRKHASFHHTFEYLQSQGSDPCKCLTDLLEVVETAERDNEILVAHNGWWFDIEFMQAHFHNFLRVPFIFADNAVYDSGISEKASQLSVRYDPLPQPGESLKQFSQRIGSIISRGVFWALGGYCEDKYQLLSKANMQVTELHRADADALLLHHLVQAQRQLAIGDSSG